MGQFLNIVLGLSTALIGYVIGRVWQHLVDWLPYRQARLFLGPAIRGESLIVTSRFTKPGFPDGVVGGGDALALRELATFFGKIGFKHFDAVYVDERHLNREKNLILLGGLDTNQVTMDAMELIRPNLTICDPGPEINMEVHDLAPGSEVGGADVGAMPKRIYKASAEVDYGIIIRARNPFNPKRMIIIVAGAYGYGTWGGIHLIQQDFFLEECRKLDMVGANASMIKTRSMPPGLSRITRIVHDGRIDRRWSPLECLFRVRVFDGRPLTPDIIVFRALS